MDSPFHLETLQDILRIVGKNSLMVTLFISPFGMGITSYLRTLDVLDTLYIDDRFAVTKVNTELSEENLVEGRKLAYNLLELLTRLGYTLSLKNVHWNLLVARNF